MEYWVVLKLLRDGAKLAIACYLTKDEATAMFDGYGYAVIRCKTFHKPRTAKTGDL